MNKFRIGVLTTLMFSFLIGSCQIQNPDLAKPTITPEVQVKSQSSYVVYRDYQEISAASDAVVIGRPVRELGIVNTSRDVIDPSKLATDNYSIGQVYEISVDEYLQGDGPKTIYVVQGQGLIWLTKENQVPTQTEFAAAKEQWGGYPLRIGQRYLLFLFKSKYGFDGYSNENTFGIHGNPSRFLITDDDCVVVEDEARLESLYPPVFLKTVRQQLEGKVDNDVMNAYPIQAIYDDSCFESSSDNSNPYP